MREEPFEFDKHGRLNTQGLRTCTVGKLLNTQGKKQGLLFASCPTGSLCARGEFAFADGTTGAGSVVRPCTPSA